MVFLILFPVLLGVASLTIRPLSVKRVAAVPAHALIAAGSILLLVFTGIEPVFFRIESPAIEYFMLAAEIGMGLLVVYLGLHGRRYGTMVLGTVMTALTIVSEALYPAHADSQLFLDRFSVLMALVIGILGTLIINYAIGYMGEYHQHHKDVKDRRPFFGFLMYLFISSMFGLVFSNNLKWMLFFWEITTLCSFFLIGYRNDRESRDAAFRALWMNVLGGIGFSLGIAYLSARTGMIDLNRMVLGGGETVLLPAALMAFAALVKSAQMPFSPWLTGAMVAPTPVSALLHSSTMVKAGVYLLLRVSPILNDTAVGICVTFIGAVTFLFASFIAVSQSDAKRVLAYSTIATLALIVICAGVGTENAAWSALLLIVFHAVAKSLLFLCVGVVDYKLGSRNIEDMDFLVMRMPKVAAMMNIGLAGMFLAPFGMIIAKAVTIKALVDVHPLFGVILAFGSGATLFFYAKWMGKLMRVEPVAPAAESAISTWEWVTMITLAILTIAVCICFPLILDVLVNPYIISVFGAAPTVDRAILVITSALMVALLVIFPLGLLYNSRRSDYRMVGAYLSGANAEGGTFMGAMGRKLHPDTRNYYLARWFGERRLLGAGLLCASFFLIIMFGVVLL